MTGPLQQVHLRFNDAAGQPTAVRIRVTDAAGTYFAPFGRLTHFATEPGFDVGANVLLDDGAWAVIDGSCEIALPPGRLKIQARKGPEYRPLDTDLVLQPGKMSFRFALERWTDLAADGWYSGDTCCYEMSPHAALLEAMANDLSVVDLLVRETLAAGATSLVNITAYSGQQPALARTITHNRMHRISPSPPGTSGGEGRGEGGQDPARNREVAAHSELPHPQPLSPGVPGERGDIRTSNFFVVVNTANQSPHGRLLLLNTHRTVYPLSFQPGEKWTLIDWCDQCHRKKGLVVADDWLLRLANGPVAELLDDEFLRRVDAIRFHPGVPLTPWFDALNRGHSLPLVAGSGKDSNRGLLGFWRTYANVPSGQALDYAAWTEAIRAGRTFVTAGPIIEMSIDHKIVAEAACATPFDGLELLANGQVIAATTGPSLMMRLEVDTDSLGDRWIAARCTDRNRTTAMTSPIAPRRRV